MKKIIFLFLGLVFIGSYCFVLSSCEKGSNCYTCFDDGDIECTACFGEGKYLRKCKRCGGEGKITTIYPATGIESTKWCPECNGTRGEYGSSDCYLCMGSGKIKCPDCSAD